MKYLDFNEAIDDSRTWMITTQGPVPPNFIAVHGNKSGDRKKLSSSEKSRKKQKNKISKQSRKKNRK